MLYYYEAINYSKSIPGKIVTEKLKLNPQKRNKQEQESKS